MNEKYLLELSKEFFDKAYTYQLEGKYDEAIENFKKSIDYYPTAEAHTFLGWSLSSVGDYEGAIDECKKAIKIDPGFGNPYNDIGAYLISLGSFEEASAWLELAIKAEKYENREYAHYNLGIIYEKTGLWFEALAKYKEAMEINPGYKIAEKSYYRIISLIN